MALQLRFIEFKNFSENWESVRLNYLIKSESSKLSINELEENTGDYPLYGASGFIKNIDFYEKEEKYIAIVKDGSGVGNSFLHEGKSSIVSTMQYLINTKNSNLVFDYYLIQTLNLEKYVIGSSIPHIYFKDYGNEKISIPPLEEQEKISNFLSAVDKKIDLLNCKLKEYNLFKKGLLQQIFGRLAKKLQFDYNSESWLSYKLSDLYVSKKGNGLSKDKLDSNGSNKCILYGELYTTYDEIIYDVKSRTNSNEGVLSNYGDILIPSSTTTKGVDLVTASVILEENVLLGGDITILRNKNTNLISNEFFAYYFTNNLIKEVSKLTQGSTIIHLYWKDFKKVKITIPSISEQNKYVDLFLNFDKKIDLIQTQIDEMEKFKKGLLQQMFI